jgi:teichuronic acid biosynthesis glycosyltransferase TuaG
MPIYNGIEFIEQSINSVKSQTYKDWELLIGINGHPMNSNVYLKAKEFESEKIKVFDMYKIKGKSNTLNNMIKFAQHDWIALLDVDDIWLPKKLESQISYLDDYDVIGTMCKYFGDLNTSPILPIGNISNFNFFKFNPIINSSSLIKKGICFWDNNYDGVEDYELWMKLWTKKNKFYNVKTIQVLHRIHNNSAFNAKGNHLLVKKIINKYSKYYNH